MAKLVKSELVARYSSSPQNGLEGGLYPSWKVLDDHYIGRSGAVETNDDEMLELGTVEFNGWKFMFIPETENGVEHTSDHLREIADLMDGLEKEQAAAAGN